MGFLSYYEFKAQETIYRILPVLSNMWRFLSFWFFMSPFESPTPTVSASPNWFWKPQLATAAQFGSRRGEFVVVDRVTQVFLKKHCHSCFWSQCEGDVVVMSEASMKTNIWRWWSWWWLRMVPLRSRYNDWWGDREKMLIDWITRKRFQMRSGYRQRWIPGQRSKLQRQVNTSIGQTRQSKQFKSLNLNIEIRNSRVGVEGGWGG